LSRQRSMTTNGHVGVTLTIAFASSMRNELGVMVRRGGRKRRLGFLDEAGDFAERELPSESCRARAAELIIGGRGRAKRRSRRAIAIRRSQNRISGSLRATGPEGGAARRVDCPSLHDEANEQGKSVDPPPQSRTKSSARQCHPGRERRSKLKSVSLN
jgi:hypothetical protein